MQNEGKCLLVGRKRRLEDSIKTAHIKQSARMYILFNKLKTRLVHYGAYLNTVP